MKLLWAGQGITSDRGFRTAPSAGALYPLEIYLVAGNVDDLAPGIYKYNPAENDLNLVKGGDARAGMAAASLGQRSVADGAIDIVIAAVYERTTVKYGVRGERFVHMEVGHAAQNICLQAAALGLGLVTIGAFDDVEVAKVVGMPQDESPLYVMPVGRIK
jgi:SagB-type dehydrogenase family enzyme